MDSLSIELIQSLDDNNYPTPLIEDLEAMGYFTPQGPLFGPVGPPTQIPSLEDFPPINHLPARLNELTANQPIKIGKKKLYKS